MQKCIFKPKVASKHQALEEAGKNSSLEVSEAMWLNGKESTVSAGNTGDTGSIPGLGISPGERNGNPLQYSCLENPMDRGASWAIVHGVTKVPDTT